MRAAPVLGCFRAVAHPLNSRQLGFRGAPAKVSANPARAAAAAPLSPPRRCRTAVPPHRCPRRAIPPRRSATAALRTAALRTTAPLPSAPSPRAELHRRTPPHRPPAPCSVLRATAALRAP
ncbi:hypothetical protein GCM10009533_37730 [Saccharopolyspora spinosporotrichia]|uniref:Uncharacterized protein n=1 Tax=Saccharopolyspora erythraea TaxID=1836 RepID=A0ABP3N3R0_SACER